MTASADRSPTKMRAAAVDSIANVPLLLALVPALCLLVYLGFGKPGLIFCAIVLPAITFLARRHFVDPIRGERRTDPITGLPLRDAALPHLDPAFRASGIDRRSVAALAIGFEEFDRLTAQYGDGAVQSILKGAAERLASRVRRNDLVVRLEGPRFCVALTDLQRVDLEMMIEICARLQGALSEPYPVNGTHAYVAASVGMCFAPILPKDTAEGLIKGAERALDEAMHVSGGAIRRYSEDMRDNDMVVEALSTQALEALSDGRIRPWFQPQISTDTGRVTGMEALARWDDPVHGIIPPGQFLPALEASGLTERLGEVILHQSLSALKTWDAAGVAVPNVGVNVSDVELRNPKFCDRVRWELDRFEIPAERLTIEILETVTSDGDVDVVAHNLWALARLGCQIDMDDFGTGNASLSSLRRFAVHRIKIDRSYISDVDTDQDQQSMVAAMVTMAEQLDLETLAEGVETDGEHAMVAQLGCRHVQGYGVARPMAEADCTAWLAKFEADLSSSPLSDIQNSLPETPPRRSDTGKTA